MKSLLKLMFPPSPTHCLGTFAMHPFNNLLCHIQLGKSYMLASRLDGGKLSSIILPRMEPRVGF